MNTQRLIINLKMAKSATDKVRDIVLGAPLDLDGNVRTLEPDDVNAILERLAQVDAITRDCRERLGKEQ